MTNKFRHKKTVKCPINNCGYTSRQFIRPVIGVNKISNHSKLCPKHRTVLI